MLSSAEYYDAISRGYCELHREEQHEKMAALRNWADVQATDRVLSVGCGPCFLLDMYHPAKGLCREMVGVDPSAKLIEQAVKRGVTRGIVSMAEDMDKREEEIGRDFDVVISLTAIQNFVDVPKGIANIERLGRDRFVLTYLKRAAKGPQIDEEIEKRFTVVDRLEQKLDIIYFLKKKL